MHSPVMSVYIYFSDTSKHNLSTFDCLPCGGRPTEAAARVLLPLQRYLRGKADPSVVESPTFCGALGVSPDVQQEHAEIIPLPAGLGEGAIEQTSAVAFSSANAELLNERGLYRMTTLELLDTSGFDVCSDEVLLNAVVETCIRH